ncbi:MAG: hypothetical protein CVV27_22120, partial [Candidatus Melainabacteria bacterium HGW-Melainabacteria-1]
VEGSLSNENLKEFESEIEKLLNDRRHIIIDFSRLSFILSSGLSAIVANHVAAKEANIHFIICGLTGELSKIFYITDLNKHLTIRDTLDDALKLLNTPV